MTVPHDTPRYLFLMRHAQHQEGQLTEAGLAHMRSLAMRFSEWVQAEWRNQRQQTVRVWLTSASTEVQETADVLTRDVLAHIQRGESQAEPYPFDCADPAGHSRGRSGNGRPSWMPALVPSSLTNNHDFVQVLSAYSPDKQAFQDLCTWLESSCTEKQPEASRAEKQPEASRAEKQPEASRIEGQPARRTEMDAPLLVGNDPLIGWVASQLTRRGTPVARGELLCLVRQRGLGTRWRLLWTLSDDDETAAEAIRTKIKSKMTTAGALGTVIVGLTTFLLQNSLQKHPTLWQWLAFAALALSAGLYFASLFLYDTLQMPPRFWSSRPPSRPPESSQAPGQSQKARSRQAIWAHLRHGRPTVARPPSSTARVLQASMMQVWNWIFTPATVLAGAGVACLALGAATHSRPLGLQLWHVLAAIVVLVAVAGTWVAWHRPNLGTSD